MSSFNRLLSRRDRHSNHKKDPKHRDAPLNGFFVDDERNHTGKDDEKKVKTLKQRLSTSGIWGFKDADISYILHTDYTQGDVDKAYELLMLLDEAEEGIIQEYNPNVQLLGAVNRGNVSCYLDAVLFAMFARLGNFEAILYKNFTDEPRKRLATLLRLWVNTLRAGKLITVDITKQIQMQLASCGWKEAAELHQQDASEAFTFITATLDLPLLTLKMDIFHTGKEDAADDHKFVNERLLELAIPEEPKDGSSITLENCLEMYFNNKIEVKRYLDNLERRNTLSSVRSHRMVDSTKGQTSHVEVSETDNAEPLSPIQSKSQSPPNAALARPKLQRPRAPSIIQEHYIDEKRGLHESPGSVDDESCSQPRVRKEVVMPAWQFFSLIPWYTNNKPSNDAQVAAHFSQTRPILGICLKRYYMLPDGSAHKRQTHIDIPLEIGLPHFISDDHMAEDGPAFGNFKLSLQSIVCHRGVKVNQGHYISLVRNPGPDDKSEDHWLRFDDLAKDRVTEANVNDFLRRESPYLLYYQVIPIEGDPLNASESANPLNGDQPPSYTDSRYDSGISDYSDYVSTRFSDTNSTFDTQNSGADLPRTSFDTSGSSEIRVFPVNGRRADDSNPTPSQFLPRTPTVDIPTTTPPHHSSKISLEPPISEDTNALTTFRGGHRTKTPSGSRTSSQTGEREGRLSQSLSRLANRFSGERLDRIGFATTPATGGGGEEGRGRLTRGKEEKEKEAKASRFQEGSPHVLPGRESHHHRLDPPKHHRMRLEKKGKPERECVVM